MVKTRSWKHMQLNVIIEYILYQIHIKDDWKIETSKDP